ncbi:hypothetical protein [Dokdonella sp.]|uniref:hypothetical protein n=1 Tax=Dokdonella sp. TaxID=2291710 RepID=UPI0025C54C7F|nr:hypothetical protein [Dokdonella sp.]
MIDRQQTKVRRCLLMGEILKSELHVEQRIFIQGSLYLDVFHKLGIWKLLARKTRLDHGRALSENLPKGARWIDPEAQCKRIDEKAAGLKKFRSAPIGDRRPDHDVINHCIAAEQQRKASGVVLELGSAQRAAARGDPRAQRLWEVDGEQTAGIRGHVCSRSRAKHRRRRRIAQYIQPEVELAPALFTRQPGALMCDEVTILPLRSRDRRPWRHSETSREQRVAPAI